LTSWTCPECGASFATPNASHSCVRFDLDAHFRGASPNELDDAFAGFVREAAARVGRRERLASAGRSS
jgi:hypothetical protein